MNISFVRVETADRVKLDGFLAKEDNNASVVINIHGTAGYFYEQYIQAIAYVLPHSGTSVLSVNNRGAFAYQGWEPCGGSTKEYFEQCIFDIDASIEYALNQGYKNIILQGHSLGTEKVVYYMNKGKHTHLVKAIILLGFSDSYGTQDKFVKSVGFDLMAEAKRLIKAGKGEQFLRSIWFSHDGVLPKTANSYAHDFSKESELYKALPLRKGKELDMYSKITVPILAVIGDHDEYTVIPISEAVDLLRKENYRAEVYQLKGCSHDFTEKENQKELTRLIDTFLHTHII